MSSYDHNNKVNPTGTQIQPVLQSMYIIVYLKLETCRLGFLLHALCGDRQTKPDTDILSFKVINDGSKKRLKGYLNPKQALTPLRPNKHIQKYRYI